MSRPRGARVAVTGSVRGARIPRSLLRRATARACAAAHLAGAVEVAVVDARRMADLHLRHLGERGPTDVLAFPLPSEGPWNEGPGGVVAVCWDVARREAARRGTPVCAELALYAVHGVLHLGGYRDGTRRDAARMDAMQRRILAGLRVRAAPMLEGA